MSEIAIQFKEISPLNINKILREKLSYCIFPFPWEEGREVFVFNGWDFMLRFGESSSLEREAQRFALEIEGYGFVSNVRFSYDPESDRCRIVVIGRETLEPFAGGFSGDRSFGGFIDEFDLEPLERYCEKYKRDTEYLRIPKTFTVYSGYSKDGRLRTVVHWQDGVKTSVYLKEYDFDDIYLAIAYCYVKRKFGTMSHFKRIVERNTREVTGNARRFIYGGDSTLLIATAHLINIYDQVALYLAISYLGDTDQWLTEEDIERLEDSISE